MKNNSLFICGFPSGGTDLTKTILNAHPDIYINGEMPFLYSLPRKDYDYSFKIKDTKSLEILRNILKKKDIWNNLENIDETDIQFPVALPELLRILFTDKNKKVWGNKTPQNSENIPSLLTLFPEAKFILVIRDVRDICLSWKKKWGKNMYHCSIKWNKRMQMALNDLKLINADQYLVIKFEDLLNDTETTTKNICTFLNLPWSNRMIEHYKYVNRKVDGKINYGKKVIADNKEKWKTQLSLKKIKMIEGLSFDALKLTGYDVTIARSQITHNAIFRLWGLIQDIYATLFIGNRFRSVNILSDRLKDFMHEITKKYY